MLQDFIVKGATDKSVRLRIIDSTDGTPETGVAFDTSGIDLWYRRELSARVAITEATLAALTTAHADGGFLHISDGYYRLDLPDAAFASGANYVEFGGVVTGMVVIGGVVKLIDSNVFHDAVRGGFTALPNAAADAAGGLPISDAGGLDLDAKVGALTYGTANRVNAQVYGMEANVLTATAINADAITAAKVAADVHAEAADAVWDEAIAGHAGAGSTGEALSDAGGAGTPPTAAEVADAVWDEAQADHVGAGSFGLIASEIADILVDTGTTLQAELDGIQADTEDLQTTIGAAGAGLTEAGGTGDHLTALATAAALTTVDGIVDAILVDTNELQTDWANGGRLDLLIDAILADTDVIGAAGAGLTEAGGTGDHLTALATAAALAVVDGNVDDIETLLALTDADVEAIRLVTDLLIAAQSEPTGVPAANATPLAKLAYLFMGFRNRIDVTSSAKTYYGDGGAAEFVKSLSDDGTTYSEGELGAP